MTDGTGVICPVPVFLSGCGFEIVNQSISRDCSRVNIDQKHLDIIKGHLTGIASDILQTSDRKARVALGTATKAIAGTGFASTVLGAVGALGTASTGTAIAGLAGAAKTTATLYWVGGLVGGGVAAGTFVVGASALGVGFYASKKTLNAIMGRSRDALLSEDEQKVLLALGSLVDGIDAARSQSSIDPIEAELFVSAGVVPILEDLKCKIDHGVFSDLKTYRRARLRGRIINMENLIEKAR